MIISSAQDYDISEYADGNYIIFIKQFVGGDNNTTKILLASTNSINDNNIRA
ncbi:MAG: hypothetical protein M3275_00635 [Thermoproteota archaeon]|nr:hypothetical protein [Thermoproteota archaeon]